MPVGVGRYAAGEEREEARGGDEEVKELVVDRVDELPGRARGIVGEDERRELLKQRARQRRGEGEVVRRVERRVEVLDVSRRTGVAS